VVTLEELDELGGAWEALGGIVGQLPVQALSSVTQETSVWQHAV
jgi:hypothetical protein